jgi:ATP-dependent Clp protease ATP-binding subunit ClpC
MSLDDHDDDDEYTVTPRAKKILQDSTVLAIQLGQTYVTSEHILYILLCTKDTKDIAIRVLRKLKVNIREFKALVHQGIVNMKPTNDPTILSRYRRADQVYYSPKVKEIIALAGAEAINMGTNRIDTPHLLLGILMSDSGMATSVFRQTNIDIDILREEILVQIEVNPGGKVRVRNTPPGDIRKKSTKKQKPKQSNTEFEKFTTDLTRIAQGGQLLPVIGRSEEIERVVQTLMRKSKNNPVITGEPGIGKTAIVEGLATRIINNDIPKEIRGKKILTVDIPLMVAGTKYRGQFEERLTSVIEEVSSRDDIILFIDELHMMVGAGDADGAMDASNILKPALSRGELTVIGATTSTEYRKFIEKDGALERRFQQVQVAEPSMEDTIQILYGIKSAFEEYHDIEISNYTLERVCNLCSRYITDRNFPDKAIDILDESCAYVKLREYKHNMLESKALQTAADKKASMIHLGEFEAAIKWRNVEIKERKKFARKQEKYEHGNLKKSVVKIDDVDRVVSKVTGIPISSVKHGDKGKIRRLEAYLQAAVIGQNHAIETIVTSIKRSHTGLSDHTRPIGSFLFLGPTGTGKTHLTKKLASHLFDSEDSIIRVDMSELMESHSVSKLMGSPPGYVGYDEGGALTESVRRNPYSVILFDEIEKAHPDVLNILLQILDEGMLTDSQSRHINFKNTIIILTSNIGAYQIQKNTVVGFSASDTESSDKVLDEARAFLPPEFINRLDEIVMFNALEKPELIEICTILLQDVIDRLSETGITLKVTPKVKSCIVDMNTEEKYGARPLKRLIAKHIENPISDFILEQKATEIKATCKGGKIVLQ